jgi:hypothetical protein
MALMWGSNGHKNNLKIPNDTSFMKTAPNRLHDTHNEEKMKPAKLVVWDSKITTMAHRQQVCEILR